MGKTVKISGPLIIAVGMADCKMYDVVRGKGCNPRRSENHDTVAVAYDCYFTRHTTPVTLIYRTQTTFYFAFLHTR